MKRIVREVITLIRIERWLAVDDRHGSPTPEPVAIDWSLVEVDLNDAEEPERAGLAQNKKVAGCSTADGVQIVSQRVIEIDKWEVEHGSEAGSEK